MGAGHTVRGGYIGEGGVQCLLCRGITVAITAHLRVPIIPRQLTGFLVVQCVVMVIVLGQ